jgi:hypothetical protein
MIAKRGAGPSREGSKPSISVLPHKKTDSARVAAPGVSELPEGLRVSPSFQPLPSLLVPDDVASAQPFFSALERIHPELRTASMGHDLCWTGLPEASLRSFTQDSEEDAYRWTLEDVGGTKHPVFLKRAHLLDPMDKMSGAYLTPSEGGLPAPSVPWLAALKKLNDPLNEAYVDALFALHADKMVLTGLSPHWCRCYGTYTARAQTYLYDITEEYDSLRKEPWWNRHQRLGLFSVIKDEGEEEAGENGRRLLGGGGEPLDDGDFEALDAEPVATNVVEYKMRDMTHEEKEPAADSNETTIKLRTPKIRFTKMEKGGEDEEEEGDDDGSEMEGQYAEFHDFPVQMTLLERATQTLEDLSEESLGADHEACWTAWLFQIIAALSTAQHYFGFVHNDLHSNNVMWSPTKEEFLYYRVHKGKDNKDGYLLKVPTYGKLMKIIDFGRASYTLPGCGFFISDAFYPGNDAADQYNCAPFYDPKAGPKLEPNPSFDLCRLAVSLLDSLFPERPPAATPTVAMSREKGKVYTATVSPVYNLLWEWLLDDDGMSVLRTPEGEERYPEFDLYCALAADVHRAIPKRQIEKPMFAKYRTTVGASGQVYDLYL